MIAWEYKMDVIAASELTSPEAETSYLNEMGHEGWELVNTLVYEKETRWSYYWKRALNKPPLTKTVRKDKTKRV